MTNISVDDYLEARVCCSYQEQAAFNVLHFQCTAINDDGTPVTTLEFAQFLSALFTGVYRDAIVSNAYYEGVGVRLDVAGDPEYGSLGNRGAGVGGTAPQSRSVCGVITKLTDTAGRAGKGRIYIPFPDSTAVDAATGKPTSSYMSLLDDIAALYVGEFEHSLGGSRTITVQSVLKHRTAAGYVVVNNYQSRARWGSQRSRGDYGKPNPVPDW